MSKVYSSNFDAVVTAVDVTDPHSKEAAEMPEAYDIVFAMHTDGGQSKDDTVVEPQDIEISVEVSTRPSHRDPSLTKYDDAVKTLKALGYDNGLDFDGVFELVGRHCNVFRCIDTRPDGKVYTHWYINESEGGWKPKKVEDPKARMLAAKKAREAIAASTPQFSSAPADEQKDDGEEMPF